MTSATSSIKLEIAVFVPIAKCPEQGTFLISGSGWMFEMAATA
jgi:hypothetical protein